ncbi:MerR family DNA-binding protein [Demequina capsici]|uniref:MerR family DNA-binding protein n=1 Tax=Demequina capsici TaxID=3075620 RepID=A0AA96FFH0_9MICO|nr:MULTISPECIES: MerR family transcriptional regulator [unclassified Demequina]WNM24717.1 MerR family DNA-binding protein [Demequina sp. OYTSA14]WNM27626.1 MerR family DNA-binding protein [Demequina sp. PMTSA13]
MRIGDLAAHAGVTAKTVRYYESIGLMEEAPRHANGYRDYGDDALAQLRFIRDSQAAGLSLAETGEILAMKRAGESTCQHTRALLERRLEDIERQIDSLLAAKAELLAMHARAETLDPVACTDPARCQVIEAGRADHHGAHVHGSGPALLGSTIPMRVGA